MDAPKEVAGPIDLTKLRAWMEALHDAARCSADPDVAENPHTFVLVENYREDTITLGDVLALLDVADAAHAWEAGHGGVDFWERCRELRAAVRRMREARTC